MNIDPSLFISAGHQLGKLSMYPYFDACHYLLMCMNVKDELGVGSNAFSRKHPISLWISSMLMCFSGGILVNLLMGENLIAPLKNHHDLLIASAIWYCVFYLPVDLISSLMSFLPCRVVVCLAKEVQRAHKIYGGVLQASKAHPGAWVVIVLCGALKGAGSGIMRTFAQLVRGHWAPGNNEMLRPSFTTKACIICAIMFTLERSRAGVINIPHEIVFLLVIAFLVYFKLSALLLGITDPLAPLESVVSAVLLGGVWDSVSRAWSSSRTPPRQNGDEHKKENKKEHKKDQ